MRRNILVPLLIGMAGLGATGSHMGGWAVVTVDDVPDYLVAKQSVNLSFVVRQHGHRPIDGLQPVIDAKLGRTSIVAKAEPQNSGRYVATLNLPHAGEWTLTVHSGFGMESGTILPMRVVEAGTAAHMLSDVERGRRLFIAKGCFTCHVNTEVTTAPSLSIGPELTGRRYPAVNLARFLANPDSKQLTQLPRTGPFTMPNLGLKDREIASLVAVINGGREVSAR